MSGGERFPVPDFFLPNSDSRIQNSSARKYPTSICPNLHICRIDGMADNDQTDAELFS
jgi:hypothetical protein